MKLPNPIAWLCTDFDGHYGIGVTKELAKAEAGEHCNDFLPLHPESDFTAFQQRIEALESELAEAGKDAEWNKRIILSVDKLLVLAGYEPDCSIRNALSCMRFDAAIAAKEQGNV